MDDRPRDSASSKGPEDSPGTAQPAQRPSGPVEETLERLPLDEAIRRAADEVRRAAMLIVRSFQGEATERLTRMRKSPAAGPVDPILDFVKKSPIQGAILALLVGFLLGRSFKK
jgi:hypothetical protein